MIFLRINLPNFNYWGGGSSLAACGSLRLWSSDRKEETYTLDASGAVPWWEYLATKKVKTEQTDTRLSLLLWMHFSVIGPRVGLRLCHCVFINCLVIITWLFVYTQIVYAVVCCFHCDNQYWASPLHQFHIFAFSCHFVYVERSKQSVKMDYSSWAIAFYLLE